MLHKELSSAGIRAAATLVHCTHASDGSPGIAPCVVSLDLQALRVDQQAAPLDKGAAMTCTLVCQQAPTAGPKK